MRSKSPHPDAKGVGPAASGPAGVPRHANPNRHHLTRTGGRKLVARCTLPLTGKGVVDRVITDLGVLDVAGGSFALVELAPGVALAEVEAATDAPLVDRRPSTV